MHKLIRIFSLSILAAALAVAALAADYRVTTLTTTNATRFTASPVGKIEWIDMRSMLPAGATVDVWRVWSAGTDTVATVVCNAGLGRGAPNTNTWYALRYEYFQYRGATSGTARVITTDGP